MASTSTFKYSAIGKDALEKGEHLPTGDFFAKWRKREMGTLRWEDAVQVLKSMSKVLTKEYSEMVEKSSGTKREKYSPGTKGEIELHNEQHNFWSFYMSQYPNGSSLKCRKGRLETINQAGEVCLLYPDYTLVRKGEERVCHTSTIAIGEVKTDISDSDLQLKAVGQVVSAGRANLCSIIERKFIMLWITDLDTCRLLCLSREGKLEYTDFLPAEFASALLFLPPAAMGFVASKAAKVSNLVLKAKNILLGSRSFNVAQSVCWSPKAHRRLQFSF